MKSAHRKMFHETKMQPELLDMSVVDTRAATSSRCYALSVAPGVWAAIVAKRDHEN